MKKLKSLLPMLFIVITWLGCGPQPHYVQPVVVQQPVVQQPVDQSQYSQEVWTDPNTGQQSMYVSDGTQNFLLSMVLFNQLYNSGGYGSVFDYYPSHSSLFYDPSMYYGRYRHPSNSYYYSHRTSMHFISPSSYNSYHTRIVQTRSSSPGSTRPLVQSRSSSPRPSTQLRSPSPSSYRTQTRTSSPSFSRSSSPSSSRSSSPGRRH